MSPSLLRKFLAVCVVVLYLHVFTQFSQVYSAQFSSSIRFVSMVVFSLLLHYPSTV